MDVCRFVVVRIVVDIIFVVKAIVVACTVACTGLDCHQVRQQSFPATAAAAQDGQALQQQPKSVARERRAAVW